AYGLGQFVDDTGKAYGLNDGTRGNLDKQADALVSHYLDNAALAKSRGEGEDFVYKYHHDGPARDYGGLAIGKDKVTPYIDDYETFVREHQRERGFAAPEQPAERASGTRQSRAADADGVLRQGESGPSVKALQEQLNRLGVTDAQGRPLQADGDFGPSTRQAVEAFQRSQPGLDADGIAGRDTLNALKSAQPQQAAAQPAPAAEAAPAPLLSDRAHPDNAMYRQAVAGLEKLGPQAGFADRQALERAAGVLTYEARVSGLNRIDHVVQSADGSRLFAVQGELQDPAHHRVVADKAQAVGQSVEQSTRQLSQDAPSPASQSAEQQTQSARPVMG
ncbi:XVIPCD domain-containing protein, partial [Lysobacter sp. 2RAB21]